METPWVRALKDKSGEGYGENTLRKSLIDGPVIDVELVPATNEIIIDSITQAEIRITLRKLKMRRQAQG